MAPEEQKSDADPLLPIGLSPELIDHTAAEHMRVCPGTGAVEEPDEWCPCDTAVAIRCRACAWIVFIGIRHGRLVCEHAIALQEGRCGP